MVPEKVASDFWRLIAVMDFSCNREKVGRISFRQLYTDNQFLSMSYLSIHCLTLYLKNSLTSSMKPLKYPTKIFSPILSITSDGSRGLSKGMSTSRTTKF